MSVRSGHPNSISADNLERALARTKKKFKAVPEISAPEPVQFVAPLSAAETMQRIRDLLGVAETAEQGNRNGATHWVARRLEEVIWEQRFDPSWVWRLLAGAAQRNGLPDDEIEGIIRAAAKRLQSRAA